MEELCGSVVGLEGGNVALDLSLVEEIVLGHSRDKLSLIREDAGPLLDGLQVSVHSLASM